MSLPVSSQWSLGARDHVKFTAKYVKSVVFCYFQASDMFTGENLRKDPKLYPVRLSVGCVYSLLECGNKEVLFYSERDFKMG